MALVQTNLRTTRESAKRVRFEPNGDNHATNVQDAIDRSVAIATSLGTLGTEVSISAGDSPYTVPPGVGQILVFTSIAAVTVNVGLASARTISALTIKDASGNADVNNIIVNMTSPDTVDGQGSLTMDSSFEARTLRKKTGGYYIT